MFEIPTINNPHDLIFKSSMQHLAVAQDFFESYLPEHVKEKAQLDTLHLVNGSFIDEAMKEFHSDLIYSIQVGSDLAYVYLLLEHQSRPDVLMPLRLLEYKVKLMRQHLRQGHKKLPEIISMCLYCGQQSPYPYSMDLIDLYAAEPQFPLDCVVNPSYLTDLSILSDQVIDQTKKAALMSYLLKLAFEKDIVLKLRELLNKPECRVYLLGQDSIFRVQMIYYALSVARNTEIDSEEVFQVYTDSFPDKKEEAMNLVEVIELRGYKKGVEQGIEQGIEQGRETERKQIIANLLSHGLSAKNIAEYTGFSLGEIQGAQKRA